MAVMAEVVLAQVGAPQEVWERPATPFVYGFLGAVNRFEGEAQGSVLHIGEQQLRTLMSSGADMLAAELDSVLGTAWDEALEPYRGGGAEHGEISWLNRGVG